MLILGKEKNGKCIAVLLGILVISFAFVLIPSVLVSQKGSSVIDYEMTDNQRTTNAVPAQYPSGIDTEAWNSSIGGSGADAGADLTECSNGDFLLAGRTTSFGAGGWDWWIVRTDSFGNHLWNKTFGGASDDLCWRVHELSSGNIVLGGDTYSFGAGGWDGWIIWTDADGNHIRNVTYGTASDERFYDIEVCSNGDIAYAGTYLLGRTNGTGYPIWETTIPFPALSIDECATGGFVISGEAGDVYIVRVDIYGNTLWFNAFPGAGGDKVVELSDGGFALVGDTSRFNPTGDTDPWLIRYDSSGNELWNITNGNIRVDYWEHTVVESSGGGFGFGGTWGWSGMWFCRVDSTGSILWNQTWGQHGVEIVECKSGGYAIIGTSNQFSGNDDFWLMRVQPIQWVIEPTSQIVEFGSDFSYDLDVTSLFGIDCWSIDNPLFTIDNNGVITNLVQLIVGEYEIEVMTRDNYGDFLRTTFTVTVEDTTGPGWVIVPTDRAVEFGNDFEFQIPVVDPAGIDHWTMDDTTNFALSDSYYLGGSTALVTNGVALSVGTYPIEITVYDMYLNPSVATFDVIVHDTTSPTFVVACIDHTIEFMEGDLAYPCEVYDLSGIGTWAINDTLNFEIDSGGTIYSRDPLSVGIYGIEVTVYDIYSNPRIDSFIVTVQDTIAPAWDTFPVDQVLEYGELLLYQLAALDNSGIAQWTIDDTVNFAISSSGLLTNVGTLDSGEYSLTITAYDPYDNSLSITIVVDVGDAPTFSVPLELLLGLGIGVIAIVIIIVLIRRRG